MLLNLCLHLEMPIIGCMKYGTMKKAKIRDALFTNGLAPGLLVFTPGSGPFGWYKRLGRIDPFL